MIRITAFLICLLTVLYPLSGYGKDDTIERSKELLSKERYAEVINLLSKYKPSVEDLSAYHNALARSYERLKMFNEYIEHLRLAYIYSPKEDRPRLLIERAEAYMRIGYYSEASLMLKIYLKDYVVPSSDSSKDTIRVYIDLGEALYNLGRYDESLHYFSKGGDEVTALYGIAKSLQAAGKIDEADRAFMRAIQQDKDFLKAENLAIDETLFRLSENSVMMKRFNEARQYLKLIKASRLKAKLELLSGIIALEEKKYDEALRYLTIAFDRGDRNTRRKALYQIAEIYIKKGKNKEAEEKLLELRLNYPYGRVYDDALLRLARLYRESAEVDKAIPLLKELLFRRSPDRRAIDEFESIILAEVDKDKKELVKLWNSVGPWLLEPSRSKTLINVAQALRGSGTSFLRLTKWLIQNGDNMTRERASLLMSTFYIDLGEPAKAREYLRLGRYIKDSDDFYRINAKLSLLNRDIKKSISSILSIKDLKKEDLNLIGEILDLIKDKDSKNLQRLINQYKRAINKGGIRDVVSFADLLYSRGQKDEALTYYRKAVDDSKKESAQSEVDWAAYRINRITKEKDVLSMIREERLRKIGDLNSREEKIKDSIREVF